ncbi:uncharacterized protein LACBIDRAFT_303224 [Laccaria bicolor S238N-H82]|uniref:Predicted protein n=1 Tax=Laccaria bicolor (strain S238N-H82 / ATCC MYA-4686) TaxID=486041 RepID=B0DJ59_LACBS|nr:uncharacterized protein LACBIDRAFT_303224 [Laccaria bicolor S238N-H82]EDR05464.1 predicted protein [Laccaria bicolor S238N-H82]|eukprot:XP_001884022.1 predicted protein [Laccaria bicolor S238N-H82]
MIGERTLMGWPFLQEGSVVAVSDSLFKYEKMTVVPGTPAKVISNPHAPQGLGHWKMKADHIEQVYSKRSGVITRTVDILLHVLPLKGLKRLEPGAFVKDCEGPERETEHAVQMCLPKVASKDPRSLERDAPPLSEESPRFSCWGNMRMGWLLQSLPRPKPVCLQYLDSSQLKRLRMTSSKPSYRVDDLATTSPLLKLQRRLESQGGLWGRLRRVSWSSPKALKVVDDSHKEGRHWEYSERAIDLIREYKAKFPEVFLSLDNSRDAMARVSDILSGPDPEGRVRVIKAWLKTKGVGDFEPVSLFCDQLGKFKKAIVKGIPRQAVLKPAHTAYHLQNQHFALGDCVTMVQDSGSVPLSVKGVVIGLNSKTVDVVWDVPFMSGITLGDRLPNPQFITSTNPKAPPPVRNEVPFEPRHGPRPEINPAPGQAPAAGFHPAQPPSHRLPMHIVANPNRG